MGILARHSEVNDAREALIALVHSLEELRFPFETPLSHTGHVRCQHCISQARDYLIDQFSGGGDPLLVAVCGATGSGKSTIVNALVGECVVRASAVRPTTRTASVVCHPRSAPLFSHAQAGIGAGDGGRAGGAEAGVGAGGSDAEIGTGAGAGAGTGAGDSSAEADVGAHGSGAKASTDSAEASTDSHSSSRTSRIQAVHIAYAHMPESYALVDCPDEDLVQEYFASSSDHLSTNVDPSAKLQSRIWDRADMCVYVTAASRYSDAAVWAQIQSLLRRGMQMAIVINRVPHNALADIEADFTRHMVAHSCTNVPVFLIVENTLAHDLHMPVSAGAVRGVKAWIEDHCADFHGWAHTARNAFRGALSALMNNAHYVLDAYEQQVAVQAQATTAIERAYDAACMQVRASLSHGNLLTTQCAHMWVRIYESATGYRFPSNSHVHEDVHVQRIKGLYRTRQNVQGRVLAHVLTDAIEELWVCETLSMMSSVMQQWDHIEGLQGIRADYAASLSSYIERHELLNPPARTQLSVWRADMCAALKDRAHRDKKRFKRYRAYGGYVLEAACMICMLIDSHQLDHIQPQLHDIYYSAYSLLRAVYGKNDTSALISQLREEFVSHSDAFLRTYINIPQKILKATHVNPHVHKRLSDSYWYARSRVESAL